MLRADLAALALHLAVMQAPITIKKSTIPATIAIVKSNLLFSLTFESFNQYSHFSKLFYLDNQFGQLSVKAHHWDLL